MPAWAEARLAGEPARLAGPCVPDRATFVAGTVPGGFPRWRSCAADPTGTCSRRSADPEGTAPGTTSSGLSSSWSRGDSVALSPTVPSAPEGSFGLTVRVRGPSGSSGTGTRGCSSPVRRCQASPALAARCLSRGPSLAGPSLRLAEAEACGAEPRSETVRPVLVPPSPCSFVPEGIPEVKRRRAGRGRFAVGFLVSRSCRSRSGCSREAVGAHCASQPALGLLAVVPEGASVRVSRTRRRDGVPSSAAVVPATRG